MRTGKWRRKMAGAAVAVLLAAAASVAFADGAAHRAALMPASMPRLYDVTTETGMPHLEESLRYAIVRQRRCLDPGDLSRAFWMLDDVSLRDCHLQKSAETKGSARYELRCDGGHGTTGSAEWQVEADQLRGTLDVKLGGKNMTFYQRVVARAVMDAPPGGEARGDIERVEVEASFSCSLR